MKLMSQDSMENYMTHEALELLATSLKGFMEQKAFIDDTVFDEISKEARCLSNKKLAEQCKMAKRRCSETRRLLKGRNAFVDKKRQELIAMDCGSESRCGDCSEYTQTHSECSNWRPNSSQSAPSTPALTLRCNNNHDLKRRSQSLEDEIASELQQCIAAAGESKPDYHSNEERLPQPNHTIPELGSIHTAAVNNHYVCLESVETLGLVAINYIESELCYTDYGTAESDEVLSLYAEEEVDCKPSHYCHTVYRGDTFLELTNDITIPLDEELHLNNNNQLEITSPTLETGGVIYAPNKPIPVKRLSLVKSHSLHSSIDSDLTDSQTPDVLPKVNFEDVFESESPVVEEKTLEESLLSEPVVNPSSQCKLSPVMSLKQKQKAMQKRRSFHGFTSALTMPLMNFARSWRNTEDNVKRLSVGSNVSEHNESAEECSAPSTVYTQEPSVSDQVAQLGQIEMSFRDRDSTKLLKMKRMDKTMSLVTGSSESLPSLPEDDVIDTNSLPRHRAPSKMWSPMPVNSHLMNKRVLPTHRSASMADLRLTESEMKSRITLAHIIDELVQTESDYVVSLRLVVDSYIPELSRDDVPQTLRGKRGVIFGNIEKIYEFHNRYFLEDLTKCEDEPFKISQCFLKHEAEFLMYALYNKNKPKSDYLMSEYGTQFFREQQRLMGDKMDLSSYLLKPVQRMGKYALILKQVLKECPESSVEYQDLLSAEEMIRFCLQHGNDLLAMDALQDCDVNLQEQGTLLLQEEFTVWKGKKKSIRHIFLFEHLLVLSKTKKIGAGRDQYIYKTSLKTADLGLTENVGTSGLKFEIWFRKRTGESWTFQASSSQIKNRWVNVIEKLLWTQALKNRESRLTELSTMGVGHKPSLDLKKSADNINDRFIPSFNKSNITGNRHSLDSLDNADGFDASKKRPYSVISLANSSSSNSSGGSTGPGSHRKSAPWMDLKAAVIGKGLDSARSNRMRRMYKSDSRIYRCDSGISSSSSFYTSPLSDLSTTANRKESETEV